jgi:heptosyltransferase I
MKVCFARVDRIGDFVLTLPCERAWLSVRPEDSIQWLLSENIQFVAEHVSPPISVFYAASPKSFVEKIKAAFSLSIQLRRAQFDTFVAIHVPWWVAFGAFLAGIRSRTGVASQWFSWVFFNRRLRQKRSQAEKNEAQYNLDLINFSLGRGLNNLTLFPGKLEADRNLKMKWAQTFKAKKLDLEKLVVIHPGMGGSARNWPPQYYRELADKLLAQGASVAVSGAEPDRAFVKRTGILEVRGVFDIGITSGPDLLSILSLAKSVVAPSTGVAHLAAALGVPVVGIYSPVRVQSPKRWAPLGDRVQVLVANVPCPGIFECLGPKCPHYDCMEQITVESLMSCVMDKL